MAQSFSIDIIIRVEDRFAILVQIDIVAAPASIVRNVSRLCTCRRLCLYQIQLMYMLSTSSGDLFFGRDTDDLYDIGLQHGVVDRGLEADPVCSELETIHIYII